MALQEVQRSQARQLAETLGWHAAWRFKHWPLVAPAEGLAILAPAPVPDAVSVVLAHRWWFWSWRRRIVVAATVGGIRVVNAHLGACVGDGERARQADIAAASVLDPQGVVAGDLNTSAESPAMQRFEAAGFRDAWTEAEPGEPGATNWPPGPRDRAPTQRLDYVLVGSALRVVAASLPEDPVPFGHLSDHLPLIVDVAD